MINFGFTSKLYQGASLMIHQTKNYDQFKIIPSNRSCENYEKILESIKRRNMLAFHPIHVDKDFRIIDGQHRFRAAKELGIDIFYVIDPKANESDLVYLNMNQKNWSSKNFMNFHCAHKLKEYLFFKSLHENYGFEVSDMIANFTAEIPGETRTSAFQKGLIRFFGTHEEVVNVCEKIKEIRECFKKISPKKLRHGSLFSALCSIVRMAAYNHKNFIHKINVFPEGVEVALGCRTQHGIKNKLIESVYNYRSSENKRLPCL